MSQNNKNTSFTVEKSCELLEFLYSALEPMPKKKVKELLAHKSILVDGRVSTQFNHQLTAGQTVAIDREGKSDFLQKNKLKIVYEDDEIIAINKPHGLLSVSDGDLINPQPTAYTMLRDYVQLSSKDNRIFIVHRLDKETSGIFIVSKSEQLKNQLQNNWNDIVSERFYYAVVEGTPKNKKGSITSYLRQDKHHMVYSSSDNDGEKAVTDYSVVKTNTQYSLLDISIKTGKKNQIRVAMKDIGHIIVGDKKYGSQINPINRMALHAYKLTFTHPVSGKLMSFETKVPDEFMKLLTSPANNSPVHKT